MTSFLRHSLADKACLFFDRLLQSTRPVATQDSPAKNMAEPLLTAEEKVLSGALMRINHVGEICAQALYAGQLMGAKKESVKTLLQQSQSEEIDHLAWCGERLKALDTHPSYLNFFWYVASFFLGVITSFCGDAVSLGFLAETEKQVSVHIQDHLLRLPAADTKSRAILEQMLQDEMQHSAHAEDCGARELPVVVKELMQVMALCMKRIAFYI
jgi:ubiquinone biosynthesis monooxygenase Coq7